MKINLDLTDTEVASIKEWLPRLQHLKQFVPSALLSLLHKVEQAIKEL